MPYLELQLTAGPQAGARFRRAADERFGGHLADDALADLRVVGTELINNAVVHGTGTVVVRVRADDDAVRIEVVDQGEGNVPEIRVEPGDETGGWGLRMVDELATRWGAFEGTTHVWAELPARRRA